MGPVPARYDLIVANIIAEAVAGLLPEVRRRLVPGGVFIGSGIVREGLDLVLNAGQRAGLERIDVRVSGEWRAVVLAARGTFSPPPRLRV